MDDSVQDILPLVAGAIVVLVGVVSIAGGAPAVVVYPIALVLPFLVGAGVGVLMHRRYYREFQESQIAPWDPRKFRINIQHRDGRMSHDPNLDLITFDLTGHYRGTLFATAAAFLASAVILQLFLDAPAYLPITVMAGFVTIFPFMKRLSKRAGRAARVELNRRIVRELPLLEPKVQALRKFASQFQDATPEGIRVPFTIYRELDALFKENHSQTIEDAEKRLDELLTEARVTLEALKGTSSAWFTALEFAQATRERAVQRSVQLAHEVDRIIAHLNNPDILGLISVREWKLFDEILQENIESLEVIHEATRGDSMNHAPPSQEVPGSKLDWALNILGLTKSATWQDAQERYRELAANLHPDKVATRSDVVKRRFARLFQDLKEALETVEGHLKPN